jgi:hypothetical protein
MSERVTCKVTASTPGADSNEYTLFDSRTAVGHGMLPIINASRLMVTLQNANTGILKAYTMRNEDTTYKFYNTQVVPPNTYAYNGPYDYDLVPYANWKLTWINMGGNQSAAWNPEISMLIGERTTGT